MRVVAWGFFEMGVRASGGVELGSQSPEEREEQREQEQEQYQYQSPPRPESDAFSSHVPV